jgi:mono/diheme cytochrome c family protein
MYRFLLSLTTGCLVTGIAIATTGHARAVGLPTPQASAAPAPQASPAAKEPRALLDQYCVTCHNQRMKAGSLALDGLDVNRIGENPQTWEKVVRKLRGGVMPPAGRPRPDRATYDGFRSWIENEIDRAAAADPNPGRSAAFHRLNRTEYRNAIRDVLALDVDVASWLPADPASYGFDNIGDALGISSGLLERYLSAAQRVSGLAVGDPTIGPSVATYVYPSDLTQRDRIDGLPFGTRGGALVNHYFAVDGEYVIQIRLGRNYNTRINGLDELQHVEVLIDGERVQAATIGGKPRVRGRAANPDDYNGPVDEDDKLKFRIPVKAGARALGVTFVKRTAAQFEDLDRPILRDSPEYGDTQGLPSLAKIEIDGPYAAVRPADTPSRRRIFTCTPASEKDTTCARTILTAVARRAYRRPITDEDLRLLMTFYTEGRDAGGFEKGVQDAIARILVSPSFLFRIEQDTAEPGAAKNYRVSDLELATRLSFFLWSSVPDDTLLDVAERGRLKDPSVLDQQVRRMLADPRANTLVSNFAGQWLHLRDVSELKPDRWSFPEFDDNLRRAFRRETELFMTSIMQDDRGLLDLLTADYSFINERLARHYGIPNIYGDHFRRVTLTDETRRGLLGQGAILAVTSSPNRTSPVRRGVYILENFLGVSPPPPLPNVPALKDTNAGGKVLSMRERMVQHRANPVCASCHSMMDPLGLALENFDGVGHWRTRSESNGELDVSGTLPDGTTFDGPVGLRNALLKYSDAFVTTFTEKLLTYALGRGLEYYDAPTVRRITHEAAKQNYKVSVLVQNIVRSPAFQMRRSHERAAITAGAGQ